MQIQSLGQEDSLEEGMATYPSILAWKIPWIEEPNGVQSMGSQIVEHDSVTEHTHTIHIECQFLYSSCLRHQPTSNRIIGSLGVPGDWSFKKTLLDGFNVKP